MSNSSINSALSGLSSAQIALDTVGNNIANSNVQGYSRQQAILAQAYSTFQGVGWIGNGAQVTGVKREYNDFITRQLRDAQTTSSQMETRYQQMKKIDDMIGSTNNVSSSLQDFFSSIQVLVSNADDGAARQAVLGKAGALVNQFKVTDDYLRNQNKQINTAIESTVEQINTYASQIADLNQRISKLTAIAHGEQPNDLLDQRDLLVAELNKLTGVEVTVQDGKSFTVSFANGTPLVQGDSYTTLKAIPSAKDPGRLTVATVDKLAGAVEVPETLLTSGSLGGFLTSRSQDLDQVTNSLNQLARVFVDSFNKQHEAGIDLNGDEGRAFFTIGEPLVLSDTDNRSKTVLTASIDDSAKVQATNYTAKFDGTGWKVSRNSDGAPVSITPAADGKATSLQFDGLTVSIDGTPAPGDSFTIKPVADAIRGMRVAISDTSEIAFAQKDKSTGVGDNRNGQLLLNLQNSKTVNGNKSYNDAWAGLVSDVGNKTQIRQVTSDTQNSVVKQLTKQQQSISGVNLDEEYGALQHYQQYYMANAKALQTASTLFNALLSAIQ